MFCSSAREFIKCNHFIVKICSRGPVTLTKDGKKIDADCGTKSIVIYGGWDPGNYVLECNDHTMLFVHKDGHTIKEEIVVDKIGFNITRYECEVYAV